MWVFAIIIVLALGGVAAVASGFGSAMPEAYPDRPDALVPADRPLGAADLRRVRFSMTFRGYRMSEVDALLDRLAAEADVREAVPPPVAPPVDAADDAADDAAEDAVDEPDEADDPASER